MVVSSSAAKLVSTSTMFGKRASPVTQPAANSGSAAARKPTAPRRSVRVSPGETKANASKSQTGLDSTRPASTVIFIRRSKAPDRLS